jgi:transcriptional regulator with XRE-family HTH domain
MSKCYNLNIVHYIIAVVFDEVYKGGFNMANVGRKLGVNIRTCMLEANISLDDFAERLGYSIKDLWNVIEGKVIIPPVELDKIASILKTTKSELINRESDTLMPDLQYMKEFDNPDNLNRILNLMDEYVELREVV